MLVRYLAHSLDTEAAREMGDFSRMEYLALGPLFKSAHKFMFQLADTPEERKKEWHYPLQWFNNSAALVLPVVAVMMGTETSFQVKQHLSEPFVFPLLHSLECYVAWPIVWRSPAWQCEVCPWRWQPRCRSR